MGRRSAGSLSERALAIPYRLATNEPDGSRVAGMRGTALEFAGVRCDAFCPPMGDSHRHGLSGAPKGKGCPHQRLGRCVPSQWQALRSTRGMEALTQMSAMSVATPDTRGGSCRQQATDRWESRTTAGDRPQPSSIVPVPSPSFRPCRPCVPLSVTAPVHMRIRRYPAKGGFGYRRRHICKDRHKVHVIGPLASRTPIRDGSGMTAATSPWRPASVM